MSLPSDFVSTYRQQLGVLLQTREKLRALGRLLDATPALLDAADDAFQGTNNDLTKVDMLGAKAVLDGLDVAITAQAQGVLFKVAGNAALPK